MRLFVQPIIAHVDHHTANAASLTVYSILSSSHWPSWISERDGVCRSRRRPQFQILQHGTDTSTAAYSFLANSRKNWVNFRENGRKRLGITNRNSRIDTVSSKSGLCLVRLNYTCKERERARALACATKCSASMASSSLSGFVGLSSTRGRFRPSPDGTASEE
jgi:hypothetical protein